MSELSITPEDGGVQTNNSQVDAAKLEQMMRDIKSKQNLGMGILGGFVASIAAAVIWGVVTYVTGAQIGYMAIGVGFLVGFAVKHTGKGVDFTFGIVGAVFALFGCLVGNLLATIMYAAISEGVPILNIAIALITSPLVIIELFKETFSFIDIVFYGIAVYAGFRYSIREVTEADLDSIRSVPPQPTDPMRTSL